MRGARLMSLVAALTLGAAGAAAEREAGTAVQGAGRQPQPESFSARVEPGEVELGRPFAYIIEVRHPPGETYALSPADMGPMRIRDTSRERREEEGVATTTFRIEGVILGALGSVELPDVALEVQDEAGPLGALTIPGATLAIAEIGEGDALAPPPGPLEVRVFAWDRLGWGAGALALAALGILLLRRRRPVRPVAVASPAEEAKEALAQLAGQRLWERGEGRLHYFRLSEILRRYLADTQGFAATEMTAAELFAALDRHTIPGLDPATLRGWFERGDLVRYANAKVDPDAARSDLEEAARTVRELEAARREAQKAAAEETTQEAARAGAETTQAKTKEGGGA